MLSCFCHVGLFATPQTAACQASLSMGFSRQEYGSGLPFPSPGDRPNPGIEPASPAWQADSLSLSHQGSPVMSPGCLIDGPGMIFRPGSDVIRALFLVACRPEYP